MQNIKNVEFPPKYIDTCPFHELDYQNIKYLASDPVKKNECNGKQNYQD